MADDIVALLRRLSSCDDDWVYTCAQEAADEIERLRDRLGCVARMKVSPDDKTNRFTLAAAVWIATNAMPAGEKADD